MTDHHRGTQGTAAVGLLPTHYPVCWTNRAPPPTPADLSRSAIQPLAQPLTPGAKRRPRIDSPIASHRLTAHDPISTGGDSSLPTWPISGLSNKRELELIRGM